MMHMTGMTGRSEGPGLDGAFVTANCIVGKISKLKSYIKEQ